MIQPAIPEIVEEDIHTSVEHRNESLANIRELGPPDLVHLIKQSKSGGRQTGIYHHITGIDASTSASLAAYVNTLVYSTNDKTQKVVSGLYCCYNAFSHVDMRVEVRIPGGVESYCIDERGEKRVASEAIWLETYLCAVLRAYSYADDGGGDNIRKIVGVRRFDPIRNTESEHKFLEAAERLFFKGPQLGSESEVQVPNLVSNHLTVGLMRYISTSGRYTSGINLFEKLRTRAPEISYLLAQVLLLADEEVSAVKLLYESIQSLPMDYCLLGCQAAFCQSKGRLDWALECAKRSVTSAPSEFGTWAKLADIYVGLEQWDLALLTLNSCPMFTHQDKDTPRLPEPARVVLPILQESILDEIDESQHSYDNDLVHPSLRKLHASNYKGTFQKAYSLLTEITAKIGWDHLLRIRSQIFVMEEEYRIGKQADGTKSGVDGVEANASATDLTAELPQDPQLAGGQSSNEEDGIGQPQESPHDAPNAEDPLEKPRHTVLSKEIKGDSDENVNSDEDYAHFRHKRLCERWLDNLFMVLYEDLRIYTIWQSDMTRIRGDEGGITGSDYNKSAEEWEILGQLAERLHHIPEAVEAYQSCLRIHFSPKALNGILKLCETQGQTNETSQALIRLIAWQYRWYSEFSPELLRAVRNLIESEGAVKIRSIVQASSLPQPVLDLTHQYIDLCASFRSSGSDG